MGLPSCTACSVERWLFHPLGVLPPPPLHHPIPLCVFSHCFTCPSITETHNTFFHEPALWTTDDLITTSKTYTYIFEYTIIFVMIKQMSLQKRYVWVRMFISTDCYLVKQREKNMSWQFACYVISQPLHLCNKCIVDSPVYNKRAIFCLYPSN